MKKLFLYAVLNVFSFSRSFAQYDCINFVNRETRVVQYGNLWQLRSGNTSLISFEKEADAKKAALIIEADKLNQQCFVGRPNPSFSYWLNNGKAPSGINRSGIEFKNIEAGELKLMHNNAHTHWTIRYGVEPSSVMIEFTKEAEANAALAIINKYHFNQMLEIGTGKYHTTFFRVTSNNHRQPTRNSPTTGDGDNKEYDKMFRTIKDDCLDFLDGRFTVKPYNNGYDVIYIPRTMHASAGGVLLHFNTRERADNAVRILSFYHITRACYLNRPNGPMQWYLNKEGNIPTGECAGEDCITFNPANLVIKKINNKYVLCDGLNQLIGSERSENEAKKMLAVIKHYQITQLCFFVRNDDGAYFKK